MNFPVDEPFITMNAMEYSDTTTPRGVAMKRSSLSRRRFVKTAGILVREHSGRRLPGRLRH